jgi:hypothetical protein
MLRDTDIERDMVVFRNNVEEADYTCGSDVIPPDGVRMLHIDVFRRCVSRAEVDAGYIEIIDDIVGLVGMVLQEDGTYRQVALDSGMLCDPREVASYLEVFDDLPPDHLLEKVPQVASHGSSDEDTRPKSKPKRAPPTRPRPPKPRPEPIKPKPKILEW